MAKNFPSLGAEQLAAAGTISDVAKRLGVADRTVAGWRAGRSPNRASQEAIERTLGIATTAWSRVATAHSPAPAVPPTSPATAPSAAVRPNARQTAEQRLREQLERLRIQREAPGLTERSRVELEKLELAASARLARLEGASGLTLRQVLASPHLRLALGAIEGVLHAAPLAAFEVINALELLEGRGPTHHLEATERHHPVEVAAVRTANAALLEALKARAKRAA